MSIEIRAARLGDAVAIQAIYASVVTGSAISFEEVPPSNEEIQQRIELTLRIYPYLVAVREGKVVGICLCKSAPSFWFGRAIVRPMLAFLSPIQAASSCMSGLASNTSVPILKSVISSVSGTMWAIGTLS